MHFVCQNKKLQWADFEIKWFLKIVLFEFSKLCITAENTSTDSRNVVYIERVSKLTINVSGHNTVCSCQSLAGDPSFRRITVWASVVCFNLCNPTSAKLYNVPLWCSHLIFLYGNLWNQDNNPRNIPNWHSWLRFYPSPVMCGWHLVDIMGIAAMTWQL